MSVKAIDQEKKPPIITVNEVRKELHSVYKRLCKVNGHNKLTKKYVAKMRYMMFWLQLLSCRKDIVDGFYMPDYSDIRRIAKGESWHTKKEGIKVVNMITGKELLIK